MPDPSLDARAVAIAAARDAAALCQAVQADLAGSVLEKEDRTPVTVADFGSQALVCKRLRDAFPGVPIIAEEDASTLRASDALLEQVVARIQAHHDDATADDVCRWIDYGDASGVHDRFWTVDPIDGTKGFVRGDQYAIAIALVEDGVPQVGALACPNLREIPGLDTDAMPGRIFAARRGDGAVQVPAAEDGTPTPISVSATGDPTEAVYCDSFVSAHSSHDAAQATADRLGLTADPIRIDSQAKYAIVASGAADIYFRLPRGTDYTERIWDHAAGMLVVEAAGGTVTDIRGDRLDFSHGALLETNRGVVASNGRFHEALLDALQAEGVE
jgi:3'(2'), 5'-bisphosphate nucleotidase